MCHGSDRRRANPIWRHPTRLEGQNCVPWPQLYETKLHKEAFLLTKPSSRVRSERQPPAPAMLVAAVLLQLIAAAQSAQHSAAAASAPREHQHKAWQYTQHKAAKLHQRVQWRRYGAAAFKEAEQKKRPIVLLITSRSWCYWCQVYESQDFLYNSQVVDTLQEHTIPVYVDADIRQDLTRQYLEGGWPSTTVLSPSNQRLFGYSGPRPPSNIIHNIEAAATHLRRHPELFTAHNLTSHLSYYETKESAQQQRGVPSVRETRMVLQRWHDAIPRIHDAQYGGFGNSKKFPQGLTLDFCLEMFELNGGQWLQIVETTLKNQVTTMADMQKGEYHLFDPIEGGFHRYGTTRTWSPPHYEKILHDNMRLLRAYAHLVRIHPRHDTARMVVNMTLDFVEKYWWNGHGWWGTVDVNGEDAYYGRMNRPSAKLPTPYVNRIAFTEMNAEAVRTFAELCGNPEIGEDRRQKACEHATAALRFYASDKVMTNEGPWHSTAAEARNIPDTNNKILVQAVARGPRGSLMDCAHLLLALVEAGQPLQMYIDAAQSVADVMLRRLYDYRRGAFFERNSPDVANFAHGDEVNLEKPVTENGVAAFGLLKLFLFTDQVRYLAAALQTMGYFRGKYGYLDAHYHMAKVAQLALQERLVEHLTKEEIDAALPLPSPYWLDLLLEGNREAAAKACMFSGNVDEADACDASGGRCDAVKREKVLPPTLTRPGYYTRPAMVALERYTSEALGAVREFSVGRLGYGEVKWLGTTDIRGLDLDAIVRIEIGDISIYDDQAPVGTAAHKPSIGVGLNKRAVMMLQHIFPPKGVTGQDFEDELKESIESAGASFISYDSEMGRWMFLVNHFTDSEVQTEEDKPCDKREAPVLRRTGYYTRPASVKLARMSCAEMSAVQEFTVGRLGYGEVKWLGVTDVRGLDLDAIVRIEMGDITVYNDSAAAGTPASLPAVGDRLNKLAVLQLEHIFPLEEEGETAESFENDLKRSIETAGASFIAYDAAFGRWTFMVEHF